MRKGTARAEWLKAERATSTGPPKPLLKGEWQYPLHVGYGGIHPFSLGIGSENQRYSPVLLL